MWVYILIRPRNWDSRTTNYKTTYVRVRKNSFKYFKEIIIAKLKWKDVCILER